MASSLFLRQGTRRRLLANIGHKCLRTRASESQLKVPRLLLRQCTYCFSTNAHDKENHENALESKLKTLGNVTRVLPTPFDTLHVVKELQKAGRVCARAIRRAVTSSCFSTPTEYPANGTESRHSERSSEDWCFDSVFPAYINHTPSLPGPFGTQAKRRS